MYVYVAGGPGCGDRRGKTTANVCILYTVLNTEIAKTTDYYGGW
jgi:hypothetical protein